MPAAIPLSAGGMLGGRRFDALGAALDGGASLDETLGGIGARPPRQPCPTTWWTGIKVVDLFCPVPAGGRIAIHGGVGVGTLVVAFELSRRLRLRAGAEVLWVGWERHRAEYADLAAEFSETGVEHHLGTLWHRHGDAAEAAAALAATVARACAAAAGHGRDVFLFVIDHPDHRDQIEALLALADRPGARLETGRGRTLVALKHDFNAASPSGPLDAGWDARIVFDFDLRLLGGCYPAIHPVRSCAQAAAPAVVERARLALAALRAHPGWPGQIGNLPLEQARALKLQWYLSQPFEVTELFMHQPGEHVERAHAEDTVAAILDGAYDAVPVERMRYLGEAPPAP